EKIRPILSGWMGHKNPFDFSIDYEPADGIDRFLCGTPPLLGLIALECGVDLILKAKVSRLRKKAVKLSNLFIELMESMCSEFDFKLASPFDENRRAGHVSFMHHSGFAVSRALASKGIVGDFRAPNIVRFGIAPMYTRFQDIYDAVNIIRETMQSDLWKNHENDISPYT
ncbi:MAG: kynureninase, partial [Woeseiaceae bacterium]|nr:kynureninase [Woeseiaceae bacterium]